ncbi:MAG: hypothetical protein O7G85_09715, partial [Planctomycetota bacterium]|nr:hypothetical protein [Planctomycetota bacterium]
LVDGGRDIVSWSWPEGEFEGVQKLPGGSRAFSITISRDGLLMAAAHRNRIDIIEFVSWKTLATLPVHGAFPTSIRISPDRSRLFAGSADGAIRIWDLPSRRLVSILYVHSAEILDLEISTDGTTLVSGGGDSTIHVLRAPPARSGTVTD